MADNKNPRKASPFAEMTFAEQQDMWRAWRSRQLDYKPAASEEKREPEQLEQKREELPPLRLPLYQPPAPPSHKHLDRLRERHMQAARQAKQYLPTEEP